jgi:DNA-binding SARP family transcriptional activator/tetratricopeptide (TPR) repeat protein
VSSELRFAVLGPVRAWRGDAELDLGAPQQRAVLAALLLAEGRQVSLGALIDALWDDDPPRASVGTVRTYVSRLRRCLGGGPGGGVHDLIGSAGDGYVLPLRSAMLDLDLFLGRVRDAHAIRDADPEQAAALLRDALGLWRGVPLSGLPGRYADSQRIRLAELRMAAVEERLALDIELGRHVAAAAELKSLLGEAPLRERLTELLMLALYKSGRQAEALAVFDGARRLLDDELGIVPGPAMRDMHQRILRMDDDLIRVPPQPPAPRLPLAQPPARADDPSFPVPLVRPAQLPADLPMFAGRAAELAQLDSLLDGAAGSRAVVIGALDGMAGIGKTALAIHWAHKVAARFQDGQLYVNLRAFDPGGVAMAPGEALRGFLDALGVAPNRIPDGLEAQAGLYRSLLNNRRILIVLDNARNVGQVRPLLPGSPGCAVLITSRNQLTGLITTHGARSLTVDAFSAEKARDALNRRMAPTRLTADPDALAEVVDLCAGLPLAMAIVAARAITRPHLPMNAIASELRDTRTRLDALSADEGAADVRAVFSWSYRLLSERAGRLFRLLSVHSGPDFSLGAAASVAGLPPAETVPLLLELTGARLITENQPGRFSSHDLIRVYATELSTTLDPEEERHAALGRLLDFYLHTAYAAHLLLRPHFVPPAPAPARPGVTPDELSDYRQAMAWFSAERHVLRAAARNIAYDRHAGLRPYTWQLALTVQQFYQRQGYCYEWAGMMHTALGAALSAGDLAAQARTRRGLAGAYHFLGRNDEALGELERTRELFTELGYEGEHAYVHSNFGTVLASKGQFDQAVAHYWQAYDLYEGLQHVKGQAAALEGIGWCHGQQGRYYLAIRYVENAMILYRRLDDRKGQSDCWARLGESRHLLGQYRQAIDCHLRAIALGQEIGSRASEAEVLTRLGDSAHAAGDPVAARQAWDNALVILDELRLPQASSVRERMGRLGRPSPERGTEPGAEPGQRLASVAVN